MVKGFRDDNFFLSNFYEVKVTYNGITYRNNEAAFQAQKVCDLEQQELFSTLSPSESKRKGRRVKLRKDWELVKEKIMSDIVKAKFSQNPKLLDKLLKTDEKQLEEENNWGDKVWGTVNGIGENLLGKILMKVRDELKEESFTCFDANKIKNDIVEWIRNWYEYNGKSCNVVIGVSGGTDSSIVAALCVEALGKERVKGLLLPCGEQADINYSYFLCDYLGIDYRVVDISDAVDSIINKFGQNFNISNQTKDNLPARIRMSTLYAYSQSINGRVANTCNLSENWIGYSTRYGDSAGDFSPLSNLTKTEVKLIGKELGLSEELVNKVPSDGLCGKTDEENLGFSYDVLDKYIRTGMIDDKKNKIMIDHLHEKNKFKLELMPCFEYEP